MSHGDEAGVPATCLRCGSPAAARWRVTEEVTRYRCWPCGGYRVDRFEERTLIAPLPPRLTGRFLTDVTGVRWLLSR